jgi:hypothetical protein
MLISRAVVTSDSQWMQLGCLWEARKTDMHCSKEGRSFWHWIRILYWLKAKNTDWISYGHSVTPDVSCNHAFTVLNNGTPVHWQWPSRFSLNWLSCLVTKLRVGSCSIASMRKTNAPAINDYISRRWVAFNVITADLKVLQISFWRLLRKLTRFELRDICQTLSWLRCLWVCEREIRYFCHSSSCCVNWLTN